MSIATKTGDAGTTGLMFNRRVSKSHPRVSAYGAVDELNAALGMARATAAAPFISDHLLRIQKELVILMGELATLPEDLERYQRDGFQRIDATQIEPLDQCVRQIESQQVSFKGWATPGDSLHSACLDMARTICRRSERCVATLDESEAKANAQILIYLNRLSDVLWLMARWVESKSGAPAS